MDESEYYDTQAELQQRQVDNQGAMSAPQIAEQVQQAQAVLVEQINPRKVVEDIMLRLRGKRKNPDGSEQQVMIPKMNSKGTEAIWFILDSHINQNTTLSHLEREEIGAIMDVLQQDLVDNLSLNWKDYGIKDKTDLDDINNSILINVFLCLKRAEGQNEKNWLGKITMEMISGMSRGGKPKKESFWSKFRL